jgi:hypothetical protein
MATAGAGGHTAALYSLAVIQFNGSSGTRDDRHPNIGAGLCARAAKLGHVNALGQVRRRLIHG